jgi:hypothetical protein
MTKLKDDPKPTPLGGRAAERLREFERARGLEPEQLKKREKPTPDGAGDSADMSTRTPIASPRGEKK